MMRSRRIPGWRICSIPIIRVVIIRRGRPSCNSCAWYRHIGLSHGLVHRIVGSIHKLSRDLRSWRITRHRCITKSVGEGWWVLIRIRGHWVTIAVIGLTGRRMEWWLPSLPPPSRGWCYWLLVVLRFKRNWIRHSGSTSGRAYRHGECWHCWSLFIDICWQFLLNKLFEHLSRLTTIPARSQVSWRGTCS